MATSQFYSVCLANESIRACRALLLASPCPFSRTFLHSRTMSVSQLSFQGSSVCGLKCRSGPSSFACRAFSSVGPSARSKKLATSQNPREEIRKLDDEIRRLEKERRSVGKTKKGTPDDVGNSLYSQKKGNAGRGIDSSSKAKFTKSSPFGQNAKFAASAGSSRSVNARALARNEQEDAEEDDEDDLKEDEDDGDDVVLDEDDGDNVVLDEDDEELGDDFSSDAEMYMETSEEEELPKAELSSLKSSVSKELEKQDVAPVENLESSQAGNEDTINKASTIDGIDSQGVHVLKHPWKEWNDFYDVLSQKNYFKDVSSDDFAMQGEGYLRFQNSAHMKRAILEFSRERDDIIRFLTKKHIMAVVTVGCPSTDRKVVNACKRLRVLCEIPEDEVCQQCKLKTFCTRAFAAPSPDLMAETVDVTRVLYAFALNASPIAESQVSYPSSVIKSSCHLVNEIVQLSAYPKDPGLPALKSRLPVKQPTVEKRDMDSNHRAGDWNCPDCNFLNFAKNRQCRECGTFKESGKQLEPGDWECPECTFVNFRRNRECRECSTRRPMDASSGEPLMPGEWKCPECQFVNFRRNTECHKCSTSRPKGLKLYADEDLEPGDWLCPQCNFKNFKRNKNCKECGTSSPDQGKMDDRWGLRKSSSGGWGSSRSLPPVPAESGAGSARPKYQEWKPDLSKKIPDDSDEDLEENVDIVFGRDGYEGSPRASEKKSKTKGGVFQHKDDDNEGLPSDFDLSDLDDLPKSSSKKLGKKGQDVVDDENDEEDDDNDMEDELSEDEKSMSKAPSKQVRGFSERWDDSASDDDESDDEDKPPTSRSAAKHKPAKGRVLSKSWDDSDDDDEDGFSDDDKDNFGGRRTSARGSRGGGMFGGREGQRDGRFGSSRGGGRLNDREGQRGGRFGSSRGSGRGDSYGEGRFGSSRGSGRGDSYGEGRFGSSRGGGRRDSYGEVRFGSARGGGRGESYGRGGYGRGSSNFSEPSDDDRDFGRSRGGGGRRGSFRGNGRGRGSSNFSESSDDDRDFGSSGGGGGRRGSSFRGNGRGRGSSNFSESSDDDRDFGSSGGGGGRRGSFRGRGRGDRGSSRGGGGFRGRGGRGRGGRGRS